MSVQIMTSLGELVVDLYTDKCPLACKNFLKLCKIKYYNGCLFHTIQKDFTAQTGDPTGTGKGGDSIYKFLYGDQARFFTDEIHLDLKHSKMGTVAMASAGENLNASQFYFTLRDDLDYLDGKHTVFGELAEGLETLTRINEAYVDEKGRPYKNIRIKHTYILDDPFDDPPQLTELIPDASPEGKPKDEADDEVRLEDDWVPLDEQVGPAELEEVIRNKEAHSSAVVLESIGDIPEAECKPPDNVLFVCKLNPVTEDQDLHTIFSRFGTVLSAEIIRDYKTGDSLCYAFIEFEDKDACERAYFKMDNALIDDRRIHVDFSQSVAKLWSRYRGKDNQNGKGRGCFKCGAPDHTVKDCTGGPASKQQPIKYILKDDDTQRGADNSRYDMVFDDDVPESPSQRKRHRGDDDREERRKVRQRSPDNHKDKAEQRESRGKDRQSERSGYVREVERVLREKHGHSERSGDHLRREEGDRMNRGRHGDHRRREEDDGKKSEKDYRGRSSGVDSYDDKNGRNTGGKYGSRDRSERDRDGDGDNGGRRKYNSGSNSSRDGDGGRRRSGEEQETWHRDRRH
ncbi:hypothetical protein SAY87_025073 [Trapa incisa]|uniref:Peptidyl-prolyl cis-trans isomerase n=1 Tax=Trapa incisa TaxID=236973 RepID=A0AAN7GAC9_9MYRT|nr:hypothetical protein SAY87_025073 [Trapa incisa]